MRINSTDIFIREINELIHSNLDKGWMAEQWKFVEKGQDERKIHPLVLTAFKVHQQINSFIQMGNFGITAEIWELSDLAIYINALKRNQVKGLDKRLSRLIIAKEYRSVRYELQVAGMLLGKGHKVEFIEESAEKTPDILVIGDISQCEIECKHKEPGEDQIDYVKSIYENTKRARKQFTKTCSGAISIEIDKRKYDEFLKESQRLSIEMDRAMRVSSSISAILLTSKVELEESNDFVYRHRASVRINPRARFPMPQWILANLINVS